MPDFFGLVPPASRSRKKACVFCFFSLSPVPRKAHPTNTSSKVGKYQTSRCTSPCFLLTSINTTHAFRSKVAAEGRALVVAANKSDLSGVSPGEYSKGVIAQVEALMPDVRAPPVLSVCALDGKGCLRRGRDRRVAGVAIEKKVVCETHSACCCGYPKLDARYLGSRSVFLAFSWRG